MTTATKPLFELGRVTITSGAQEELARAMPGGGEPGFVERYNRTLAGLIERHVRGDWGDVDDEDKATNERSVAAGSSQYPEVRFGPFSRSSPGRRAAVMNRLLQTVQVTSGRAAESTSGSKPSSQTSRWISALELRHCSSGASTSKRSAIRIARSNATQAITFECTKWRRGPRTSQMPSSGRRQVDSR